MKKYIYALAIISTTSCSTVPSGHKGVEVSWGGKTNMEEVYPEGMHTGIHWLWDNIVRYDIREKTLVEEFQFNDKNNMLTKVELSLDYKLDPINPNQLHVKIGKHNIHIKVLKTLKSAAKEVVPQYTASELNLSRRNEAEKKISEILDAELPEFFVLLARVQLTDVDIPSKIAEAAESTAKQQELNKLALEKAQEAENNYKAAEWDAKTKEVLSKPAMLQLKELELQGMWIDKWNGSFGNNNVFGNEGMSILKGMTK